jgi:hypothetical protein
MVHDNNNVVHVWPSGVAVAVKPVIAEPFDVRGSVHATSTERSLGTDEVLLGAHGARSSASSVARSRFGV